MNSDELWEGSKKLPCGHIFHLQCLKSWLLMQQVLKIFKISIILAENFKKVISIYDFF